MMQLPKTKRRAIYAATATLNFIALSHRYYAVAFSTQSSFDNWMSFGRVSSHFRFLPRTVSPFRISTSRRHDNIAEGAEDVSRDLTQRTVTDEEALLACRAYIQRKNRLGWTQYESRKKLARRSLALASPSTERWAGRNFNTSLTNTNSGVGYFWEDPNELKYLRKSCNLTLFDENDEQLEDFYHRDDEESKRNQRELTNEFYNPFMATVGGGQEDDEEDSNEVQRLTVWDNIEQKGVFNSFPMYPSDAARRRSESKKKLFQKADFKAKWYEKRWGTAAKKQGIFSPRKRS